MIIIGRCVEHPGEELDEIDVAVRDAIAEGLSDRFTDEDYESIFGDLYSAIQTLRVARVMKDRDMWVRTIERITRYAKEQKGEKGTNCL